MFKLLPSQRASLYQALTSRDFNPADFDIVKLNGGHSLGDGESVKLKKTDFYFAMYNHPGEHSAAPFLVTFSPGAQRISGSQECHSWNVILNTFENYLRVLRRELSIVDPWENAKKYAEEVHAVPQTGADNLPLTGKEKDDIQKTLEEIKRVLLDHVKNDKKKQQYLATQFRVLHEAVTKFGKKDYLMLVYTTVIGIATTIGVPPGVGTEILQMLNGLMSHMPRLIA